MGQPVVSKRYDTVVVGSGIAGLAAAKRLAAAGHKVAVLERAEQIGGHLLPFRRGDHVFEVGLHYLADCGPGSHWRRALDELGVAVVTDPLDPHFERIVEQGDFSNTAAGFVYPIAEQQLAMRARFSELGGALDRFFGDLEFVWGFANSLDFPLTIASVARQALKSFATKPAQLARILHLVTQPVQKYFYEELKMSAAAAELFLLHHVLMGSDPARLSALMYLLVHRYYFETPCFVRGGGQAIIDALKDSAVDYYTGQSVVCVDSNETIGKDDSSSSRYIVQIPSANFYSRNVIWTADPRILRESSRFELPALLRARLSRAANPHSLVVGYFVTSSSLKELGFSNANYWIKGEFNATDAYHHEQLQQLVQFAPVYLSTGSLREKSTDVRRTPGRDAASRKQRLQGQGVIQAMFLVPPHWEVWAESDQNCDLLHAGACGAEGYRKSASEGGFRRDYLRNKKNVLETLTVRLIKAFPALQDEIVWRELGTPLTHHRFLNSNSLGGYGFASTVEDLIWARPSYRTGRAGLYLAGAFTLPSHGIVTSLLSGVGVGRHIARTESKQHPVR